MLGGRLRQARLSKGLTLEKLANRMKEMGQPMTRAALSNYENGKRRPTAGVLLMLASILSVRPSYFMALAEVVTEWSSFRCQYALSKRLSNQIRASALNMIEKYIELHETMVPDSQPNIPKKRKVTTPKDVERAADNLRKYWKLGRAPIDSLTKTIEDNGGIVIEFPTKSKDFDGLAGCVNNKFPVLVVNSDRADDRVRLTLGHELGHVIMDMPTEREEEFAYRFAGALLAPADVVREEVGTKRNTLTLGELSILKKKYGMSMQAWFHRLANLNIITNRLRDRSLRHFKLVNWHKEEPVAFVGDEKPSKYRQMVLHAYSEGIITPAKAEELLPGCTADEEQPKQITRPWGTMADLLGMPRAKRRAILAKAVEKAKPMYEANPELRDLEPYEEDNNDD